ncbi:MAG: flagellar biosynthesis protein FlhB [Desulfovibrionaceae bacterium]
MPQADPSRTEKATTKRRTKARNDGSVPKSQEMGKMATILAGLVALVFYIEYIGNDMLEIFHWFFTECFSFDPTKQNIYNIFVMTSINLAKMLLPILLFIAFIAYVTLRLQVGALWTTKVFKFNLNRLFNLSSGLQRMFVSAQTLIRLGKSLLMAIVIGIAPYIVIRNEMAKIPAMFFLDAHGVAAYILTTGAKMVTYAMLPIVVIAAADLVYTRWDYEENLKMTKDEVKDEQRQAEGDPAIRAKQKQKMMEVMMRRMMAQVPKADLIITNPTHYAIALRYNPTEAPAPVVLAKGLDRVAERIKEIAREHNIPIKENKPLARALYSAVEVGDMIPEELFQAVATMLAQLHKFKRSQ